MRMREVAPGITVATDEPITPEEMRRELDRRGVGRGHLDGATAGAQGRTVTPQRPALAEVLAALDGAEDSRAFEESLVARDLWPAASAPEVVMQFWETQGSRVDVQRLKLLRLASVASCGVPSLRTVENLLREAWQRLPNESPVRVLWMTRAPADAEVVSPLRMGTWGNVLAALREGVTPDLPLGIDPSFIEPLRDIFALGFDVTSVQGDRVVVVVPPLP